MSLAVPWSREDSNPQPSTMVLTTKLKPAAQVRAHTNTHTHQQKFLEKANESFTTDVLFQSNNLLSTAEHLFSDGGACQDWPMLDSQHIHLWNNTQLEERLLTMSFLFFCPIKQPLFNSTILLFPPSFCPSDPRCPALLHKSSTTDASLLL